MIDPGGPCPVKRHEGRQDFIFTRAAESRAIRHHRGTERSSPHIPIIRGGRGEGDAEARSSREAAWRLPRIATTKSYDRSALSIRVKAMVVRNIEAQILQPSLLVQRQAAGS